MTIQEWFDKRKEAQIERRAKDMKGIDVETPELWTKCVHCDTQILKSELEDNLMVCPHCDYHFRINAKTRIKQLFDKDSFVEFFKNVQPCDPLNFVDTESYAERLKKAHASLHGSIIRHIFSCLLNILFVQNRFFTQDFFHGAAS